MFDHQPDELNLLRKLQESTTSDIDEDRGTYQKDDRVLYQMFESGLSESDLIRMLGSDEFALRSNHNGSIATIAEAIGEEVSRYSIIFEDGFIINDVTPSELLPVKEEVKEEASEEVKVEEAKVEEKAKDVPEKPKIEAEEIGMEDMSEEDLEKAKSKSAESGNAIAQVEDKEVENEELPKPSKEQNVSEGIKDIDDEQLSKLAANTRKSYNHWKDDKSQPEKAKRAKDQLDAYEKELDRRRNESKYPFMRNQEPLWLCNECFTTFRSNESTCTKCESKLTEKISEAKDSDLAAAETKEVFRVTWKNKETGKEEETNVMAFDKTAAEKEATRPSREDVKAEGPITSESKLQEQKCPDCGADVYEEADIDGWGCPECGWTGDNPKFESKEKGDDVPFESELKEEDSANELKEPLKPDYGLKFKNFASGSDEPTTGRYYTAVYSDEEGLDHYPVMFSSKHIPTEIAEKMLKIYDQFLGNTEENPYLESKIKEGVQELIGEVPGIEKDEQEALRKAIEDGTISNEWPSDEEMVDALTKAGVDSAIADAEDLEDFRLAYLKHVLLTLAMKPHLAAKESDVSEEEAELYVGAPVKVLRGRSRGQTGEIVDIQIADEDPEGQGQIDVKLEDGRIVYLEWEDVEMLENNPEDNTKEEEQLAEADADWDLTFKYKHNMIQHNPIMDSEGITLVPTRISGKKVRVFSDYQAEWVERNKGVPVRETIKEDRASKSAAQMKQDVAASVAVEVASSEVDPEVYNLSIVELPKGDKILVDTDADKDELSTRGKALARQLGAQFVGVVSEEEEDHKDNIPGGLADKNQPEDFDAEQLEMGIKVEMEHTDDPDIAREIAMDHLKEHPNYYSGLEKMEDELSAQNEEIDVDTQNEVLALYNKFRAQSRSREEAVQATVKALKINVDAPAIRNLLMSKGVTEQEEDKFSTVAKGLEEEDAKKMAAEKDGQVVTDDENKDKFAVIVKDE